MLVNQVDVINEQFGDTSKPVLQFTTTQSDVVIADEQHPIRLGLPFIHASEMMVIKAKTSQPALSVGAPKW
ncbi:MAG: hypothetical protein U1E91_05565 [Moraxella sp.]